MIPMFRLFVSLLVPCIVALVVCCIRLGAMLTLLRLIIIICRLLGFGSSMAAFGPALVFSDSVRLSNEALNRPPICPLSRLGVLISIVDLASLVRLTISILVLAGYEAVRASEGSANDAMDGFTDE